MSSTNTPTDHAELARLAERCTTGDPWYTDDDLRGRQTFGQFLPQDRVFIAAANPARVLALLAEIAALRVDLSRKHDACQIAQGQAMENGSRATQAERQRDEAVTDREGWVDNYCGAMDDIDSLLQVLIARINGEKDLASAAEWVRLNYPIAAEAINASLEPKI